MSKRALWATLSATLALGALIAAIVVASKLKDVSISEAAIQQKIAEKVPFEKEKLRVKILVDRVDCNLDNNLINLSFDVRMKGFTKELQMKATANGTLVYSGDGTFRFRHHNLQFSELTIKNFNLSKAKEELALAGVEAAVSWYLQNYPVYRLPDNFKGNVARIALESVEIRDRAIIAHLSFWQLSKAVLAFLVMMVILIILAVTFTWY